MPDTAIATTGDRPDTAGAAAGAAAGGRPDDATSPPGIRRRGAARLIRIVALCGWLCFGLCSGDHPRPPQPRPPAGPAGWAWFGPSPPPPTVPQASSAQAAPLSLAIPAIGVRSRLLHLGLNADGTMEVPQPGPHYDEPGWYRFSPSPGALGPSVIVGHVDSAARGPSVFFRLAGLRPRDTVLITRADGVLAVFAADDVRRYPKRHFPTALVYGDTDHAVLRLITCGGAFDRRSGHYLDNVVVSASLVQLPRLRQPGAGVVFGPWMRDAPHHPAAAHRHQPTTVPANVE